VGDVFWCLLGCRQKTAMAAMKLCVYNISVHLTIIIMMISMMIIFILIILG
jgi:hypothetical protein